MLWHYLKIGLEGFYRHIQTSTRIPVDDPIGYYSSCETKLSSYPGTILSAFETSVKQPAPKILRNFWRTYTYNPMCRQIALQNLSLEGRSVKYRKRWSRLISERDYIDRAQLRARYGELMPFPELTRDLSSEVPLRLAREVIARPDVVACTTRDIDATMSPAVGQLLGVAVPSLHKLDTRPRGSTCRKKTRSALPSRTLKTPIFMPSCPNVCEYRVPAQCLDLGVQSLY